jgi:hypothetical protein
MNQLIVDAGALNMALNVLRRAGKDEVVDELEKSCETVPDEIKHLKEFTEMQSNSINELTKEHDALIANCVEIADVFRSCIEINQDIAMMPHVAHVLNVKPSVSLVEHDTKVATNAFLYALNHYGDTDYFQSNRFGELTDNYVKHYIIKDSEGEL